MAASVQVSNPAPGTVLLDTTLQSLVNQLRPLLSIIGLAGGTGGGNIFAQQSTPTTAQQGGIWLRLTNDVNGRPSGFYFFYQGRWVPIQNQPVGTIVMLYDDPEPFFNLDTGLGLFDGGTTGVAGDWYGWQLLLQGNNTHLQNKFPAIANAYDKTADKWTITLPDNTKVSSISRNEADVMLTGNQLPSKAVTGYEYDASADDGTPQVIVSKKHTGNPVSSDGTTSGLITASQKAANNYPPTSVLGFVRFRGYIYLDPTQQIE